MDLNDSLTTIRGIGETITDKFGRMSIFTVSDLIHNYPRRYDDYSVVSSIASIKPGLVTVKATLKQITGRYVRRGMHITEAIVSDKTSSVRLVWFNQPYRATTMKIGDEYYVSGQFELSNRKFAIMSPACELVSNFPINTARMVPVYRETKGLNSNQIRKAINQLLPIINDLEETLPSSVIAQQALMPRSKAIRAMHFPKNNQQLTEAQKRLGFEEIFELTYAALLNKKANNHESALKIPFNANLAKKFVSELHFQLTADQRKVVWQIYQDLESRHPMNRMIEGDVGSGKTVVASMAALMAMEQGFQVAFMAPTELLARQHAETITKLLKPLNFADNIALLVGGLKASQKQQIHNQIKSGGAQLLIGTHALIQQKVDMKKLGLIIIDEQHRFGVEQRKKLQAKAGHMPHVLTMTATPIPRSLALTLYGELDISVIKTKPLNRLPIKTLIESPNSRAALYAKIDLQIAKGRQVFVVCPLVNESGTLARASVETVYDQLSKGPFKHRRVGLLHGQQKSVNKQDTMQQVVDHKLDVLVATTVIEVGVDVPNATVMLIENADSFGLAQLHQLRGRVGRSSHQGYCYLMLSDSKAPTKRLRALASTNDGFKLAELDLELRGPGAIYGTLQHGALDLRVAKLTDVDLISKARKSASICIDNDLNLLKYKHLAARVNQLRAVTNLN